MLRLGLTVAFLLAAPARAHTSDFSVLQLRVLGERIEGVFEIALRDARIAVGLDGDVAGEAGWAGLEAFEPALRSLLEGGVSLATPAGACPVVVAPGYEPRAGGREVARLLFAARCPEEIGRLEIDYRMLRDLDPSHRGYFTVEDARVTHAGVFGEGRRAVALDIHRVDRWRIFGDYTLEGVWHIWTGWDHVLFLMALLLPAPLLRDGAHWRPQGSLAATTREVVKVVTAFTVAHSLTLVFAVLGVVTLPPRPVESAIALSVAVAAWNNLRPFLPGRGFLLAAGFGLVHGLGFASALAQLGLPRQARGLALFAFNAGVELGQLAVVAVALPVIYALRARPFYPRFVLGAGSFAITWLAAVWLVERISGYAFLPRL